VLKRSAQREAQGAYGPRVDCQNGRAEFDMGDRQSATNGKNAAGIFRCFWYEEVAIPSIYSLQAGRFREFYSGPDGRPAKNLFSHQERRNILRFMAAMAARTRDWLQFDLYCRCFLRACANTQGRHGWKCF